MLILHVYNVMHMCMKVQIRVHVHVCVAYLPQFQRCLALGAGTGTQCRLKSSFVPCAKLGRQSIVGPRL